MTHDCGTEFQTTKVDRCSGTGIDRCYGINPMILELWFQDTDGIEEYFDNFVKRHVSFCPYCGLKSE